MENTNEVDQFTGRPASTHEVFLRFSGLSSDEATKIHAAFVRLMDKFGSQDYQASNNATGQSSIHVKDGSTIVAALSAMTTS